MPETDPVLEHHRQLRPAINAAIARSMREAVRRQALLGVPVVVWENDQVVRLSPEETLRRLAAHEAEEHSAATPRTF